MVRKSENDGDILDMMSSAPMAARFSATKLLEAYWDGLSEGQSVPYRSQLDPRAIETVLEYAFVLERIAPGVCRFRLAGRHLNDLMGQEVRGMPATALFEPESRMDISRLLEKVCAEASLVEVHLTAVAGFGRGALQGRLFLAPLRDENGMVTRILGCLQSHGTIGRQPRRFSVMQANSKATDFPVATAKPNPATAFAEPAARFEHRRTETELNKATTNIPTAPAPASKLRLVVDNS